MTRDDWLFFAYAVMLGVHAIIAAGLENELFHPAAASGVAAGFGLGVLLFRIGVPK